MLFLPMLGQVCVDGHEGLQVETADTTMKLLMVDKAWEM